jgi:hypothetical protein
MKALLSLFRKRSSPRTIVDPVFGTLRQEQSKWTGEVRFSPAGKVVFVNVEAGDEGPSEDQRAFYRRVEVKYPELAEPVEQALLKLVESAGAGPVSEAHFDDFTLDMVGINGHSGGPVTWDLWFGWAYDPERVLTLYMEDWRIVDVGAAH